MWVKHYWGQALLNMKEDVLFVNPVDTVNANKIKLQ